MNVFESFRLEIDTEYYIHEIHNEINNYKIEYQALLDKKKKKEKVNLKYEDEIKSFLDYIGLSIVLFDIDEYFPLLSFSELSQLQQLEISLTNLNTRVAVLEQYMSYFCIFDDVFNGNCMESEAINKVKNDRLKQRKVISWYEYCIDVALLEILTRGIFIRCFMESEAIDKVKNEWSNSETAAVFDYFEYLCESALLKISSQKMDDDSENVYKVICGVADYVNINTIISLGHPKVDKSIQGGMGALICALCKMSFIYEILSQLTIKQDSRSNRNSSDIYFIKLSKIWSECAQVIRTAESNGNEAVKAVKLYRKSITEQDEEKISRILKI